MAFEDWINSPIKIKIIIMMEGGEKGRGKRKKMRTRKEKRRKEKGS